jgi:ribosomal protein S12 methylthiotransferase
MIISKSLNENKIGSLIKVIVDRIDGEYYICRSEYDSPEVDNEVLISNTGTDLEVGNFYNVKISSANEFDIYGEIPPTS